MLYLVFLQIFYLPPVFYSPSGIPVIFVLCCLILSRRSSLLCYLFALFSLLFTLCNFYYPNFRLGLPLWLSGKESTCQCRRQGFSPWVGKILWRRKWQPIPVFLPGKSQGQRSLEGYRPWGCKRVGHELVTKQH